MSVWTVGLDRRSGWSALGGRHALAARRRSALLVREVSARNDITCHFWQKVREEIGDQTPP